LAFWPAAVLVGRLTTVLVDRLTTVLVGRLTTVLVGCLSERFFLSAWQPPDSTFLLTVWLAVLAAHTVNEGPVRVKYKCLVPIYVFPRNETVISKTEL
jgi:hypothetical protein